MAVETDVTRAKHVYPAIGNYVSYASTLPPRATCYGLCYSVYKHSPYKVDSDHLRKLLDTYVASEPGATPACVTLPEDKRSVPFNCTCGACGVPTYVNEAMTIDAGKARLANPYRRAFINWVCRLAGKPELLP